MIETAIISALAPAAVEALKNLFGGLGRKIGGLSVEDEIKLSNASVERLKALAVLDNPVGTPSQWVVDLRASFRYIAAGIFVLGGLSTIYIAPTFAPVGLEAALAASSFIFGERMLLSLRAPK
jgi:hypothetical protein